MHYHSDGYTAVGSNGLALCRNQRRGSAERNREGDEDSTRCTSMEQFNVYSITCQVFHKVGLTELIVP